MKKTNISFKFTAGFIQGKTMEMSILLNNKIAWEEKIEQENFVVVLDCVFPCEITFVLKGKEKTDTIVDKDEKILQDKFLRIDSIVIDRMPIKKWILENRLIKFDSHDNLHNLYTNYFAYNGQANISINSNDYFVFFLDLIKSNN